MGKTSKMTEYKCKCGSIEFECVEKMERTCYLVAKADADGQLTFRLDKKIDPNPDGDCGGFSHEKVICSRCGEEVEDGLIDSVSGWDSFEDEE